MVSETLLLLSCGTLGIFLGAQITEACLIVPFWKSLNADEFFKFQRNYGKAVHSFFAPITILAAFIPLISAGYHVFYQFDNLLLFGLMGLSSLAFFSTFFLYFKHANRRFAERDVSNEKLPFELRRWGNWHWVRVCFEFITFGCSLLLLNWT